MGKRQKIADESFIIHVLLFRIPTRDEDETKEQFEARKRKMKLYKKTYQQVAALSLNVEADEQILKQCLTKLVEREPILTEATTKVLFEQMLLILRTNDKFDKPTKKDDNRKPVEVYGYIDAIYLHSYMTDKRKHKSAIYKP